MFYKFQSVIEVFSQGRFTLETYMDYILNPTNPPDPIIVLLCGELLEKNITMVYGQGEWQLYNRADPGIVIGIIGKNKYKTGIIVPPKELGPENREGGEN